MVKDIQIKHLNNGEWENLYPKTKTRNITDGKGESQEVINENTTAQLAQTAGEINAIDGRKVGDGVLAKMGDLSQEVKESMTGGSVAVVGPGTVTLENLANDTKSKIDAIANETNMKNSAIVQPGILYTDSLNYGLHDSYPNAVVYFVKVDAGKSYQVKTLANQAEIVRNAYAFFKTLPESNNPPNLITPDLIINDSIHGDWFEFTVSESGYVGLYYTNTGEDIDFLMLEKNKLITDVRLKQEKIEIKDTSFIETGVNLYNPHSYMEGILNLGGEFRHSDAFPGRTVVMVEIEPGKSYTIAPQEHELWDRFRCATFNDYPINLERPSKLVIGDDEQKEPVTFVNDTNAKYLAIFLSSRTDLEPIPCQVNEGDVALPYEEYKVVIDGWYELGTGQDKEKEEESESKKIKLYGEFNKIFTYDEGENILDDIPVSLKTSLSSDIHALYDTLVTNYPNTISRRRIGYGSTSEGLEDTTLPIYEYTIKLTNNINMNTNREEKLIYSGDVEFVEILMAAGTHGNEKMGVYALYKFFKNLIENKHETLASIRDNCLIKVVPIVNVSGYNLGTYENANGVNINRNYEDGSSKDGFEPYSEHETKAMREFFTSNPDADIYIDLHTFRGREGTNQVSYHYSFNDDVNKLYATFMRRMSNSWKGRVISTYEENEALGYSESVFSNNATSYREAFNVYDIEFPSLLEFGDGIPDHPSYSDGLIKIGVELITNYISSMLGRYFT